MQRYSEPFVISTHNTADVLLDKPTHFEFKHTSYKNSQKHKRLVVLINREEKIRNFDNFDLL